MAARVRSRNEVQVALGDAGVGVCGELIYPPSAASLSLSGWTPSSVPVAITALEFDIQACSFAEGFGRALSALVGRGVRAAVRARGGVLYSTLAADADQDHAAAGQVPLLEVPDLGRAWRIRVRPAALQHERFFTTADAATPADAAGVLREVAERMTMVTYDHHTLILPARLAIAEFCDYAVGEGIVDSELEAFTLLAGYASATTRMAALVWDARGQAALTLPPLAQEGDGYGLAHPSWLERREVPGVLAALYGRCDPDRGPQRLLARSAGYRRELWKAVASRVAGRPVAVRARFGELHLRARQAARLTEGHAPLHHARLPYAMRRLVWRLGARLVGLGLLECPEDLLYLRIREVARDDRNHARRLVEQRRAEADGARLDADPAASPVAGTGSLERDDPLGGSPVARRIRQVFGSAPAPDASSTVKGRSVLAVVGYPAALGRVQGRLRRVVRQADLAKIEPGDVVFAADNGAVWSYAAPAASAMVAAGGSVLGHLAALARDYGLPCVVGLGRPPAWVRDGQRVEVDGATGVITCADPTDGSTPAGRQP